jgi:hypothetical protein
VKGGKMDIGIFYLETHAIMIALYFTDRQILVEKDRKTAIALKGKNFTPILTPKGSREPQGIERTLLHLLPAETGTIERLQEHVAAYRRDVL